VVLLTSYFNLKANIDFGKETQLIWWTQWWPWPDWYNEEDIECWASTIHKKNNI